jgi:hypothetical protein
MDSVILVHPEERERVTIPLREVINKCRLFENNFNLATSPYKVQSSVSLSIFREFISALKGETINITDTNFRGLEELCEEFGFSEFSAKLSKFHPSIAFKESEDCNSRERIAIIEGKTEQHDHDIAILQSEFEQLSTNFDRLSIEVSALRSATARIEKLSGEISSLKTQLVKDVCDAVLQKFSIELSELRKEVSALQMQTPVMRSTASPSVLTRLPPLSPLTVPPSSQKRSVLFSNSEIIWEFPEIFAEFREK